MSAAVASVQPRPITTAAAAAVADPNPLAVNTVQQKRGPSHPRKDDSNSAQDQLVGKSREKETKKMAGGRVAGGQQQDEESDLMESIMVYM